MTANNQNTFCDKINKISLTALILSQISTALILKFGSWYFDLPKLSIINNVIITIYILTDINIYLFKYSLDISKRLFNYFDNLELFRIDEKEMFNETYKKMPILNNSKEDSEDSENDEKEKNDEIENYKLDKKLTNEYQKAIDNLMFVSQRTNFGED